jgi:two-component system sensor histidine kinase BarA
MPKTVTKIWHRILVFLHLSPLSLAEKCRLAFGIAVVLVLVLALLIPYVWMGQLTRNAFLNAGRVRSDYLLTRHFQLNNTSEHSALPALSSSGVPVEPNTSDIYWVPFEKPRWDKMLAVLDKNQRGLIKDLIKRNQQDGVEFIEQDGITYSDYIRIFRARDSCLSCHNPQGPASSFSRHQIIGAAVIRNSADQLEFSRTVMLNWVWIACAFAIALVGAIVVFYWITQRVILRPIRQLRGLANNVAEGNLDIRSSIHTRDEYERLAEAFNHMLDNLQDTQQKLRDANKQLDQKIAQLSERNIELFKANKVKGEFLANMSHEFRTPLNAILGFAEILREKTARTDVAKNQRYAENIIAAGKSLLNMINDLLDLAKTEAGKMRIHIDKISTASILDELVASFSVMTKNKKIKVKLIVGSDIPELNTDAGKLRQILYNFVSNAVKFTPERGRIEIRTSMLGEKMLRISVTDTGPGIADKDQQTIFEKFRQADGSLTRGTAGTGLGLALSKELAVLLAGSVGMKSEINKGSTFWLDIPVSIAPDTDKE